MASERGLELARRVWGWEPHSEGQREFILCPAKVKAGACGRRWGKTEATAIDIALYALENPNTIQIVVAPTADQTTIIMNEVSRRLNAVPGLRECFVERQSPYHTIRFRDACGLEEPTLITARTAGPTGKGLRGRKAHRVIVDEAAFVPDEIMDAVVTPLLADYDGELVLISTPRGRNHFFRAWSLGMDPEQPRHAAFRFPSEANPHLSRDYILAQRAERPERTFRIEYLAEFLDDAGGVFLGVQEAVDARRQGSEDPDLRRTYSVGADLARLEDFTVVTALDQDGRQVHFERFNRVSWERTVERIVAVARRYRAKVTLDSTGVGDPIYEAVRRAGVPCAGYTFSAESKERLIDHLAVLIESGRARLQDLQVQTNELQAFQYQLSPSGHVRMSAPEGMHDDCVIALALAAWGLRGATKRVATQHDG